jgi:hypothetical protein
VNGSWSLLGVSVGGVLGGTGATSVVDGGVGSSVSISPITPRDSRLYASSVGVCAAATGVIVSVPTRIMNRSSVRALTV